MCFHSVSNVFAQHLTLENGVEWHEQILYSFEQNMLSLESGEHAIICL